MTIDRRSVLEVGLMGAAAGSFSLAAVETAAAQSSTKTYVLVHGAWHGGWCWKEVAEELRRMGHRVSTPRGRHDRSIRARQLLASSKGGRGLGGEGPLSYRDWEEPCRALRQQKRSATLSISIRHSHRSLRPFFLDLQRHLDHSPDCFRPRWLVGLLLSPFVDAGCEGWRHS